MSAPRSVWVLVWPDGEPGSVAYESYDDAHDARVASESWDRAIVRYNPQVVPVLTPPASPVDVAPASRSGPVAVPAGRGGDYEHHTWEHRSDRPSWHPDDCNGPCCWRHIAAVFPPDAAEREHWIGVGGADITRTTP